MAAAMVFQLVDKCYTCQNVTSPGKAIQATTSHWKTRFSYATFVIRFFESRYDTRMVSYH